jgi:hypothetical protein
MPSKKRSKGKGKKAAGKRSVDDEQQQETLDSQMQWPQIEGKQQADDDEDALLEEAIKLAAAEKKDIEEKERANCKHGYNLSSFQERLLEDFMDAFMTSCNDKPPSGGEIMDYLYEAFVSTDQKHANQMLKNVEAIQLSRLADGTKFILDGNYTDARIAAVVFSYLLELTGTPSVAQLRELCSADEHTLVQFFRKKIPCSCLDEKYKEVKSITKMGICWNDECPLPDRRAVRSKMVYCIQCRRINYCSRECQKIHWPLHKGVCKQMVAKSQENRR